MAANLLESINWDVNDNDVPVGLQPPLLLSIRANDVGQDIQGAAVQKSYNAYDFDEEEVAKRKKRGERQKLWTDVYSNEKSRKEVLPRLRVYTDSLMKLREKEAERILFEKMHTLAASEKEVSCLT